MPDWASITQFPSLVGIQQQQSPLDHYSQHEAEGNVCFSKTLRLIEKTKETFNSENKLEFKSKKKDK